MLQIYFHFNCAAHIKKIIMEAADIDGGICRFIRKRQCLFVNEVRTRPVINYILDLIKFIEKFTFQVVIDVCCLNDDSGIQLFSGLVQLALACVPHPSLTKPCSGPPLPSRPGTVRSDHTSQTNQNLRVKCPQARF